MIPAVNFMYAARNESVGVGLGYGYGNGIWLGDVDVELCCWLGKGYEGYCYWI